MEIMKSILMENIGSDEELEIGDKVKILRIEGIKLVLEKVKYKSNIE